MIGIPALLQRRPDIDVILLDDAYQHRSVKAGLTILITDYSRPFYKDHILPFGRLRESRSAYKRANIIIMSKCPMDMPLTQAKEIEAQIKPLPYQQVFFTGINYDKPYDFITNEAVNLPDKNIILVCGIARPEPLISYLKSNSADIHTLTYADHHYFVTPDLEEIKSAYENWNVPNKIIVTTEKDAARLHLHFDKLKEWDITIAVLPIAVTILFNKGNIFDEAVLKYVDETIAENNNYGFGNTIETHGITE